VIQPFYRQKAFLSIIGTSCLAILILLGVAIATYRQRGSLIVELKSIQALAKAHEVQLVNYLFATAIDEGLLLNFGAARLEFKKKFRVPKSEPISF